MILTLENGSVERIKHIMKPSAKTINKHVYLNIQSMLFPCLGDMIMKYYLSLYQRAQATTTANSKFELFPISSLLLFLFQFVKCWRIFSELNYNWAVSNFRKRKRKPLYCVRVLRKTRSQEVPRCCRATTARNVRESVMHVQSCFAKKSNQNFLLPFCRSRCRRFSRCLSPLQSWINNTRLFKTFIRLMTWQQNFEVKSTIIV